MPRHPRFKIYRDRAGQWRWTLLTANNRTIADSSEGYWDLSGARRALKTASVAMEQAFAADVEVVGA